MRCDASRRAAQTGVAWCSEALANSIVELRGEALRRVVTRGAASVNQLGGDLRSLR
jgi:hypothetical protein